MLRFMGSLRVRHNGANELELDQFGTKRDRGSTKGKKASGSPTLNGCTQEPFLLDFPYVHPLSHRPFLPGIRLDPTQKAIY